MITAFRPAYASYADTTTTPEGTYATTPDAKEPVKGPAEPSQPRTELPKNPSGMGRDEFLKMLVAQLKNQDPLNPMDGKDMAAQLAQFSSVEQLIKMNEAMDAQQAAQEQVVVAIEELKTVQNERADELAQLIEGQMAMATVGKTAVTTGNTTYVEEGGKGTVMFDAGAMKSGIGRITLTSADGSDVRSMPMSGLKTGQQTINLEDLHFAPPLAKGKYTIKMEVATESGQFQGVKTYTTGRISGMRYEQGNPMLIIGDDVSVPMSQLIQIRG